MIVRHFFDKTTFTLTYVVHDPESRTGVVIDPVTDYDPAAGSTGHAHNEAVAAYLDGHRLGVPYVLDTHAHADHLTGMPYFKERYGARTVIGAGIADVQARFRDIFNLGPAFPVDGSQFDRLLADGEALDAGPLRIVALHTPGHTPACLTYRIGDALFTGDALFMPDFGTGRCDFPGGSAEALYDSIQRLYALPDDTRVFTGHDYLPGGRDLRFESTIGEEKRHNIQLKADTPRDAYIRFRAERDAGLAVPRLILPSLQINIRAGLPPEPEDNGTSYLKIPLNRLS